jgi:hypothetical protein
MATYELVTAVLENPYDAHHLPEEFYSQLKRKAQR